MRKLFIQTSKAVLKPAIVFSFMVSAALGSVAQNKDSNFVKLAEKETSDPSNLKSMATELLDGIGPRLVGTPQMQKAHDWAVAKYKSWGIEARNEKWGEWRGWERGITHVDLIAPRVKSLEGMMLAWSPGTNGKTVTAETILLAEVADSAAFQKWLPNVKGKFVLLSAMQPSGRPDYNWEQYGLKESIEKNREDRRNAMTSWNRRVSKTGMNTRSLALALEKAGAAGLIQSNWSQGFGVNKIFGASTKKIPTIDISLEDYGLLYRLTENGQKPQLSVRCDAKDLGVAPTYNTIAEIKGSEKANEYVMLSAHFDSWDGASGATDNGTGTITMMEAMRILKKILPNPKRTILVGHWGSEEQGLNGSRAFVEDHPEIVKHLQALFNQDNGTGRVVNISGQGFMHSYDFIQRWLSVAPDSVKARIQTSFPGSPGGGGSDHASFVAAGAPGFSLSSLSWSYGNYTWHTNRDTYDKIVWDDVQNNVLLTVILAYMASEDDQFLPRDKSLLPVNSRTGQRSTWPAQRKPNRKGGMD